MVEISSARMQVSSNFVSFGFGRRMVALCNPVEEWCVFLEKKKDEC